jgi:hypothetical protein
MRILIVVALVGCTVNIDGDDSDPGPAAMMPGELAVARGALWVQAKVPYCQAPNHQRDYDSACSSICDRPDNPDWDQYRSDCSGFVSWAWKLPAPGRSTDDFAPFANDISYTIDADELRPGDAVNKSGHIMLFEAWTKPGAEAKFMEETGCSSSTPYAIEITAPVTTSGSSITVMYHGTYTAIRYDQAL